MHIQQTLEGALHTVCTSILGNLSPVAASLLPLSPSQLPFSKPSQVNFCHHHPASNAVPLAAPRNIPVFEARICSRQVHQRRAKAMHSLISLGVWTGHG